MNVQPTPTHQSTALFTPAPQPHQFERLLWLEALRGAAAVWVVLHHAVQSTVSVSAESGPLYRVFANGDLGVVLFFTLSGFIIAMTCDRSLALGQGFKSYAQARLTRIYPPYLPVGLAMLALYLFLPGLTRDASQPPGLITSLTLLPSQASPALSVAWTLIHELVFYALYSLIFWSRRLLHSIMLVWVAVMLWVGLGQVELSRAWTYFLAPINLCFVLGVATFHLTRQRMVTATGAVCLGVGLALVAVQAAAPEPSSTVAAAGFAFIIAAATSPLFAQRPPGRVMVGLGAASYSVYLVHKPALGALSRALSPVQWALPPSLLFAALAGAGLLAGLLYFHGFERHALRLVRRAVTPLPAAPDGARA